MKSDETILQWQTKLEKTFRHKGVTGGNLLQLMDMENAFANKTVSAYHGQTILLDSFQSLFFETLENVTSLINRNGWSKDHPQYITVLAYFVTCFKSFRAAEILFHKGYASDAQVLLRSLKERAIYLCGVANNITTIKKMTENAGADLKREGATIKKKAIQAEESMVIQKILRGQSGLAQEHIRELSKWEELFNAQVHGSKHTLADSFEHIINGVMPLFPCERELNLAFYMNRVSEIAWMFSRLLLFLQPSHKAFGKQWCEKWQVLDDSFRYYEIGLLKMNKKIADSFMVMIDTKFAFNIDFYYFEADGTK